MDESNKYRILAEESIFRIDKHNIDEIPDSNGQFNNVIVGIDEHCSGIFLNDIGQEKDIIDLVYVTRNPEINGLMCRFPLFHQDRNDFVFTFSKHLELTYRHIDFFNYYNYWQKSLRTIFEKLGYFTLTLKELQKLSNPTVIIKGKGLQVIPYIDRFEYTEEFLESKPPIEPETNYVYLFANDEGNYKIGRSKNPVFRERTLQSQQPEIKTLAYWKAPKKVEKELHAIFSRERIRGEWFKLRLSQIRQIKDFMKPYYIN